MSNEKRRPADLGLPDTFWRQVSKTSSCWLWRGRADRWGYGRFTLPRVFSLPREGCAHRWAYEAERGAIPSGLVLDHLCRNPACVRPDHLEPVTIRENNRRSRSPSALNALKTHCTHGHPFTSRNTYRPRPGHRQCRTCNARRARDYQRKTREALAAHSKAVGP
jgi:hypothetical protein